MASQVEPNRAVRVFYCYDPEDDVWQRELDKHLSALKRQNRIVACQGHDVLPGKEWEPAIDAYLNTADIILLLISPDFLASDYCWGKAMQRALERHRAGEAHVVPIILRPSDWDQTPLAGLTVLPTRGKAITQWDNRDSAFCDVARGLRNVIDALQRPASEGTQVGDVPGSPPCLVSSATMAADEREDPALSHTINRNEVLGLFRHLMHQGSRQRILPLVGEGNMGKSHLLTRVFLPLAREVYRTYWAVFDLRNPMHDVAYLLSLACQQLARQDPRREMWRNLCSGDSQGDTADLSSRFVEALGTLEGPVLLLVDSVEKAEEDIRTWLMDVFLAQVASLNQARVVIAGRSLPEPHASYASLCAAPCQLHPVEDVEAYKAYCQRHRAWVREESIWDLAYSVDFVPGRFAPLIQEKYISRRVAHGRSLVS